MIVPSILNLHSIRGAAMPLAILSGQKSENIEHYHFNTNL